MNENGEILFDLCDGVAEVTLNRPGALNALTLGMVRQFDLLLKDWTADDKVRAVVVRGAGEKAFCAGGDVQKLYNGGPRSPITQDFFREEYRLNRRIHFFPKPYVAIMDGITMGGGVGLSVHAGTRIAADNTMLAMPETGIGLFPDVGGSWFLPRLPGEIGMYLAMTGARLTAADCVYVKICDAFVPSDRHDDLIAALRDGMDISTDLREFACDPGPSPLVAVRETIDRCFAGDSVEAIETALTVEGSEWALEQLSIMAGKSPTSQKISFRQLRKGANLEFDACMVMEYRMSQRIMEGGDFFEGVRAVVVEKDMSPKWTPATLADLSEEDVDRYFCPLVESDLTFLD
ncbi:MAG: enoyl-CoA hydratase/isomerase family protein [Pseudomonadota bacterium]|nr:enoyl-CoA hydratase/isomerase family protein [Pseudomonadota bacterium]